MSKATHWVTDNAGAFLLVCLLTWGGLGLAAMLWALDDAPPIELRSYTVTPARPGETMLVIADVHRQLDRDCNALYSRRLIDSRGVLHAIEGDTSMSAGSIREMDKRSPGKLMFTVPVPWETPPGRALIVTPLAYTCNPWHALWPITMSMDMQAEVLAP